MIDIDDALAQLRRAPVHAGLASIDQAVMDALAAPAPARMPPAMIGLAATAALLIGVGASLIQPAPLHAARVAPFGIAAGLAPSTLLGAGE